MSKISLKEAPTNSLKGTIPASDLNLSRNVAFYQNYMALIGRKGSQEQHFYQTLFGVNQAKVYIRFLDRSFFIVRQIQQFFSV